MENTKPVYCMHCKKWYASTQADQCHIGERNIPSGGLEQIGFAARTKETIYGHPSKTNANHDCPYYDGLGFFGRIGRKLSYGIPLKPSLESEVDENL